MSVDLDSEVRLMSLAALVREMRRKQREFFDPKRRTASTLRQSKALEADVDRMVDEILDDKPRLF